jgi:transcriptional regulator with PAS, ATPase and Fis domain
VDVRVVAATNRNIEEELREKRFREDLYYRLNVIPIHIPPLRERASDIPHLLQHFLNKYSLISGKNIREIDDEAMDILLCYEWPGNVRELENTMEYAFARTKGTVLHASKLPPKVRLGGACGSPAKSRSVLMPGNAESSVIHGLLEKHHWNRTLVAKEMGIGRTTLWRKMRALGLDRP